MIREKASVYVSREPIIADKEYLDAFGITIESCEKNKKEIEAGNYVTLEQMKEQAEKVDLVNSPPHYQLGNGLEVIDVIEDCLNDDPVAFASYCEGNVIKYILRARKKGKYLEDLKKARFYLNLVIEAFEPSQDNSHPSIH